MAPTEQTRPIEHLVQAVQAIVELPSGSAVEPVHFEALRRAWEAAHQGRLPNLFQAAVEQAPVAISITDLDARILYANPMFEQVTGHRAADVVGRNESILSDRSTPRRVYEKMWKTLTEGRRWSGVLVNRRKDKQRYIAELTVAPVLDEQGVPAHYLGIHRDITELFQLERKVHNQKRLIESIVDAAMPMALLDSAGSVVLDNLAYKTLAQDIGAEPAPAILGSLGKPLRLDRPSAGGEAFSDETVALPLKQGGSRWFTCSGSWIHESEDHADTLFEPRQRHYLLLVLNEVTRLKQQQEVVRRNALRALVAEEAQVQSLREAISGAAYQLQGPFNLLRAALTMLERKPAADPSLIDLLRQVLDVGGSALERLHGAVPREAPGPMTAVNLNELVRDALSLATERMLALGVVVEWRAAPALPAVHGYGNRLLTLIIQLLNNALDALEEARASQSRTLLISTESAGDVVLLTIEDSGSGIDPDLRGRLFEPFFTTRSARGHVGMGLTVVREILNQHAGTLDLEGSKSGCVARVQLPLGMGLAGEPSG